MSRPIKNKRLVGELRNVIPMRLEKTEMMKKKLRRRRRAARKSCSRFLVCEGTWGDMLSSSRHRYFLSLQIADLTSLFSLSQSVATYSTPSFASFGEGTSSPKRTRTRSAENEINLEKDHRNEKYGKSPSPAGWTTERRTLSPPLLLRTIRSNSPLDSLPPLPTLTEALAA